MRQLNPRMTRSRKMEIASSFSSMLTWRHSSSHGLKAGVRLRIKACTRGTLLNVSRV